MKELGKQIKERRLSKKLYKCKIAKELGMDWKTITAMEEGKSVSTGYILKVIDALGGGEVWVRWL